MYTDGITEAESESGAMFGTDRLTAILSKSHEQSPETLLRAIIDDVESFSNHQPPTDDRTLVVARVG